MSLNDAQRYLIVVIAAALLLWLLFFVGPELFDQHNTVALLAALAIYIAAPFALFYGYRYASHFRKDGS